MSGDQAASDTTATSTDVVTTPVTPSTTTTNQEQTEQGKKTESSVGQSQAKINEETAKKVYRETGALRPAWKDPNGPRKASNYDKESEQELKTAREKVAGVASRDPDRVGDPLQPDLKNPHAKDVYDQCKDAVQNKRDPGTEDHFVIWTSKGGKTPDPGMAASWPYQQTDKISNVYGPFRNNATGGNDTYIIFYDNVPAGPNANR
jgi:hypothetical protein